jgi:arabinose-5-phosphate isomerase
MTAGSKALEFAAVGRRVIAREAQALTELEGSIDQNFSQAVDLILQSTGRVIVSGMGKSGHIARKIAATFASTGTPAHFVHPAEASHGDLGMMARGDVALVMSNSGETPELADMIAYTRRFEIPLIGIAGHASSTLLVSSDVALLLPPAQEACDQGIVPTTSTTMTLALGDALAIALMEHRKFTPENFRDYHPGGKLGARLSKVSDLMHIGDQVPVIKVGAPMSDALLTMTEKGFGTVAVVDGNGALAGVITDGDLRRKMDGLLSLTSDQVMSPSPTTIKPSALAEGAVQIMNDRKITSLFVVGLDAAPVGIIHIHDCLRAGLG